MSVSQRIVWGIVLVLLGINVPVFLCLHLTLDTVIYDLQARCALEGGVLYQDIVEPNLPGVVWVHMFVRSIFGWSDVVLRLFDLAVVTGIIAVLSRLILRRDKSLFSRQSALLTLSVFAFYLGLLEWCHCQRDLWMLLPCLLAVQCRISRLEKREEDLSSKQVAASAFLEGVYWSIAFWIKPHIAVPALCVILMSAWLTKNRIRIAIEISGVLAGGILMGILGSLWLIQTGAWDAFWVMQLEWNPEYVSTGRSRLTAERMVGLWNVFFPWSWAHVVALIVSARTIQTNIIEKSQRQPRLLLLIALYIGWLVQVFVLQYPFMYVHVPALVLALAISFSVRIPSQFQSIAWKGFAVACLLVVLTSPILSPVRLSSWWDCVSSGPSMKLRKKIQVDPQPSWEHLEPVIAYLKEQGVQDGEVTVYTNHLVQIYPELEIRPSTRYVFLDTLARLFKSRTDEISLALEQCQHRFAVSSLTDAGMTEEELQSPNNPETQLPEAFPEDGFEIFPFSQPVVFRSGPYVVHRVTQPIGKLATEFDPLEHKARIATEPE